MWSGLNMIDFIGQTGFIIALSTTSTVIVFVLMFDLFIAPQLLAVVFFITMGSYSLDRILEQRQRNMRTKNSGQYQIIYTSTLLPFTILILIFGCILAFTHSLLFGLFVTLGPLIIFIYSYEIQGVGISIKKVPYLKDLIIAVGWCALVLVVLIYFDLPLTLSIVLFSIGLLIKFYVMAAIYDFKDIRSDQKNGIRTFANTLSERTAKNFLHILNALATVWIIALIYLGSISPLGFIFFPAWIYQTFLIMGVSIDTPRWFYYLPCDLEQVFWLLFIAPLVIA
ncbi:UbiA family prenyltransferase [[Eubacterium] cellulosolvens]